jgi:putative endonuclease
MINTNSGREPTEKQIIGRIGEDAVCLHLIKVGYKIIDRNYLKKWGELDIVAKKDKKIYFVEVKTVTRISNVNHETSEKDKIQQNPNENDYRAEDNMHPWKLQRLGRAVQSYLLDKDIPEDVDWQFDLATVQLDGNKKVINVLLLPDIVL